MNLIVLLLLLLLFMSLIVVALSGNVLVCAAVFFDRKLRRQPENLFLVSLAVSDLLVSILVMLFAAANDLLGYWPFGEAYCEFWICFDITCCTASILNLCAIAFDRYCHISRPMMYARYSSKRLIIAAVGVVWVISAFLGAAQVIFGAASEHEKHRQAKFSVIEITSVFDGEATYERPTCQLRLSPQYAIVSSTFSFFLPATLMVILYVKLYLYARMHVRSIRAQLKQATSLLIMQLASEHIRQVVWRSHTLLLRVSSILQQDRATHAALDYNNDISCNNNSTDGRCCEKDDNENHNSAGMVKQNGILLNEPPRCLVAVEQQQGQLVESAIFPDIPEGSKRPSPSARSVSDQKARVTLGVIMGTFLLCWLPFFVVNIWRALLPNFFPIFVFQVVTWLGYANSTANPVIYGIFNRDFRRAFKRIVVKLMYCNERSRKPSNFFSHDQNTPLHRFSN